MLRFFASTIVHRSPRLRRPLTSSAGVVGDAAASAAASVASQAKAARIAKQKREGNISSVFASLSGEKASSLPARFIDLKRRLIAPTDDALKLKVEASWARLLHAIKEETATIQATGPDIVPQVDFAALSSLSPSRVDEIRKRGCFVVRNVIPRETAIAYNEATTKYCKVDNASLVKGFPDDDKQVFEVYWSPAQLQARSHPNLLASQKFAAQLWHAPDPSTPVDLSYPVVYADRLRQRHPGDAKFALGPHADAGSLERWEDGTYAQTYSKIFAGAWEEYDAFDCSTRPEAVSDLYNGAGACAVWRAFQGWLALSDTGPNEGTLEVFPNIRLTTAAIMLRPFFRFKLDEATATQAEIFDPAHWEFDAESSTFPNSAMGRAQEMSRLTHPHMNLTSGMVSIPSVSPGDVVYWHGDGVHAVSSVHIGQEDSCVMYIPSVPLTPAAAGYVAHQRRSFESYSPPEDFPGSGGEGERNFRGRGTQADIHPAGRQAMGYDVAKNTPGENADLSGGQRAAREAFRKALDELGFK